MESVARNSTSRILSELAKQRPSTRLVHLHTKSQSKTFLPRLQTALELTTAMLPMLATNSLSRAMLPLLATKSLLTATSPRKKLQLLATLSLHTRPLPPLMVALATRLPSLATTAPATRSKSPRTLAPPTNVPVALATYALSALHTRSNSHSTIAAQAINVRPRSTTSLATASKPSPLSLAAMVPLLRAMAAVAVLKAAATTVAMAESTEIICKGSRSLDDDMCAITKLL